MNEQEKNQIIAEADALIGENIVVEDRKHSGQTTAETHMLTGYKITGYQYDDNDGSGNWTYTAQAILQSKESNNKVEKFQLRFVIDKIRAGDPLKANYHDQDFETT